MTSRELTAAKHQKSAAACSAKAVETLLWAKDLPPGYQQRAELAMAAEHQRLSAFHSQIARSAMDIDHRPDMKLTFV